MSALTSNISIPDKNLVINFPLDNQKAKIIHTGKATNKFKVITRDYYYYNKGSKDVVTTLGYILDNVFYPADEYNIYFTNRGTRRTPIEIEKRKKQLQSIEKSSTKLDTSSVVQKRIGVMPVLCEAAEKSGIAEDLASVYSPDVCKLIISLACLNIISNNNSFYLFEHLSENYLTPYGDVIKPAMINETLKELGSNDQQQEKLFDLSIERSACNNGILVNDGTSIVSKVHIPLTQKGVTKQGTYDTMINYSLTYDIKSGLPVMYRLVEGNKPDGVIFENLLKRLSINEAKKKLIVDRAYGSESNLKLALHYDVDTLFAFKIQNNLIKSAIQEVKPTLQNYQNIILDGKCWGQTVEREK